MVEHICEAYEAGSPLSEQEKQQNLAVHLEILEALIQAESQFTLYGCRRTVWSIMGCCQLSLRTCGSNVYWMKSKSQYQDEQCGLTISSSISDLFFDCDFDEINWSEALAKKSKL